MSHVHSDDEGKTRVPIVFRRCSECNRQHPCQVDKSSASYRQIRLHLPLSQPEKAFHLSRYGSLPLRSSEYDTHNGNELLLEKTLKPRDQYLFTVTEKNDIFPIADVK